LAKRLRGARGRKPGTSPAERKYLQGVLAIYRKAREPLKSARRARSFAAGRDLEGFHLELFMHQVDFKLRSQVDRTVDRRLRNIRRSTERSIPAEDRGVVQESPDDDCGVCPGVRRRDDRVSA
jgi:hypothetical protein